MQKLYFFGAKKGAKKEEQEGAQQCVCEFIKKLCETEGFAQRKLRLLRKTFKEKKS